MSNKKKAKTVVVEVHSSDTTEVVTDETLH